MKPVRRFRVHPRLPDRLRALERLAYNLRWAWDHQTIDLFRRLDRNLWETTYHNPVLMLGSLSQARLEECARNEAFLAHMDRVAENLDEYVGAPSTWYRRTFGAEDRPLVAYFSMEFGVTECLRIYSGGLGILAGDHLKSASDLGVPLVAVGLLYQEGYFRQYLNPEGWQQELYPVNDFHSLPVRQVFDDNGEPVTVAVGLDGRTVLLNVWRAQVGRVDLLLLDANVPSNSRELRKITAQLYGGDLDMRIRQEILLGVGGVRALDRLEIRPQIFHMNEGHCAFLAVERMRQRMKTDGLDFQEAREAIRASTVFTTHTPVPAGTDIFPRDLVERYLGKFRQELGLESETFMDLGRVHPGTGSEPFNMAVLAIRSTCFVNGVSRLHGEVTRKMWHEIWPDVPLDEIPIGHITNGIHPGSWISDDMRYLYDRYLGPGWAEKPSEPSIWHRGEQIPGEELWRTHERRRERLVAFSRRRLVEQLRTRGMGQAAIAEAENVLDPEALTIGFGRRFATYKRATLLLRDPERLSRIVNNQDRPVQFIFAGKAHPRDDNGKALIRELIQLSSRHEFRKHFVFLENYDAVIARYLVEGVDVWLNTPRRPMEASGTSGMKAAFNGAANLSIPDGWWAEAASARTGWRIGRGEDYLDHDYQDRVEAGGLYDLLEREVVPLFYDRSDNGLPLAWIGLMKSAMSDLCPVFNTNRMVQEYISSAYHPARQRALRLETDDFRRARDLAAWRSKVREGWSHVGIESVEVELPDEVRIDDDFTVEAKMLLGRLRPEELAVQVYLGRVDEDQEIVGGEIVPMEHVGDGPGGVSSFRARVRCRTSGLQGVTVRAMAYNEDLAHPHCANHIVWAK